MAEKAKVAANAVAQMAILKRKSTVEAVKQEFRRKVIMTKENSEEKTPSDGVGCGQRDLAVASSSEDSQPSQPESSGKQSETTAKTESTEATSVGSTRGNSSTDKMDG